MTNPLLPAPRERTVELFDGATEKRLLDLDLAIDEAFEAEQNAPKRMGVPVEKSRADELAAEADALKAAAHESPITVRLRELPHRVMRQMQDDAPPRKGNVRDEASGYNVNDFERAWIRASMVTPEVTDAQFEEFADNCGTSAWSKLMTAVRELQLTEVEIPKGLSTASVLTRLRARASKQQPATE